MATFAEQFKKKKIASPNSFVAKFKQQAGSAIRVDYLKKVQEADYNKRKASVELARQNTSKTIEENEKERTTGLSGFLNKINKAIGKGQAAPVLVGETPEYTQARKTEEAEIDINKKAWGEAIKPKNLLKTTGEMSAQAIKDTISGPVGFATKLKNKLFGYGYSEQQLKEAQPSPLQVAGAVPKMIAENAQIVPDLGGWAGRKLAEKITGKTSTRKDVVAEKLRAYWTPKNAEEAKALATVNMVDILIGFGAPIKIAQQIPENLVEKIIEKEGVDVSKELAENLTKGTIKTDELTELFEEEGAKGVLKKLKDIKEESASEYVKKTKTKFREVSQDDYKKIELFVDDVRLNKPKGKNGEALKMLEKYGVDTKGENADIADRATKLLDESRVRLNEEYKAQKAFDKTVSTETKTAEKIAKEAPTVDDFLIMAKQKTDLADDALRKIYDKKEADLKEEILQGVYGKNRGFKNEDIIPKYRVEKDDLISQARKMTKEEFKDSLNLTKPGASNSNLPVKKIGIENFGGKGVFQLPATGRNAKAVLSWENKIKKGERPVVLISENGFPRVVDGTHRLQAYKNLGFKKIPTAFEGDITDIWKKAQAKYRTSKEVTFKEKFKKIIGKTLSDDQYKEIKTLNQKFFGDDDVRFVGQIIANKNALGKYEQGIIDIVAGKGDIKDTFLHEAVHKYLEVFSSAEQFAKALEETKRIYKVEGSWAEVEEVLAENFIQYFKDKTKTPETLREFFELFATKIKSYLKNKSEFEKVYDNIMAGKKGDSTPKELQRNLSAFKKDRREMIKDYLNSEEGVQAIEELRAITEIAEGYDQNVLSGIKNNPSFKKEKQIYDDMGEGFLMEKDGKYVVVDSTRADLLEKKGWRKKIEIDELANEAGFERGEDYLNEILKRADDEKLLMAPEKLAKEKLMEDEGFKALEAEIMQLNKKVKEGKKQLGEFKKKLEEPKAFVGRGESVLAKRINENLPDGYEVDSFYDKENIINELNKASVDIKENKTKAIKDAFDRNTKTTQRIVKKMELAKIAENNGDYGSVNAFFTSMRKEGTETAQALNMFKAYGFSNPETVFMKNVVDARLGRFKATGKNIEDATKRVKLLAEKTTKEIKEVTSRAFKIKDAQEIFDKIICK